MNDLPEDDSSDSARQGDDSNESEAKRHNLVGELIFAFGDLLMGAESVPQHDVRHRDERGADAIPGKTVVGGVEYVEGPDGTGAASGAGGTIDSIYEDLATRPIGDNAVINADARAANGIVTDVEVINSGIGYQHNANLTLQSTNTAQQIIVSGLANVTTTGVGEGFWASKESFLTSMNSMSLKLS